MITKDRNHTTSVVTVVNGFWRRMLAYLCNRYTASSRANTHSTVNSRGGTTPDNMATLYTSGRGYNLCVRPLTNLPHAKCSLEFHRTPVRTECTVRGLLHVQRYKLHCARCLSITALHALSIYNCTARAVYLTEPGSGRPSLSYTIHCIIDPHHH